MPSALDPAVDAQTPPAANPPPAPLIARVERVVLLVAALLIAALHAVNLFGAGPLWRDEIEYSVFAAMPSWARIWSMLKYDNFPPLTVAILRVWHALGWENVGGPDLGYRFCCMLVGLALPGALWFNARVMGGRRNAPWFSLGLIAAGGFVIRMGDAVRPYGMGWVFMLLTFGLIWRVVQSPRPGRIALAALAAILGVQSLYQDAFALLAMGAAGMFIAGRAGRGRAVAAVAGIGALAAGSLVPYILGPIREANAWSMVNRTGVAWGYMSHMIVDAAGSLEPRMPWLWPVAMMGVAAAVFSLARKPGPNLADDETTTCEARWYVLGSVLIFFPMYLGFLKLLGMTTVPWYYFLPLTLAANALDVLGGVMERDTRWRIGRMVFLVAGLFIAVPFAWQLVQVRVTNADVRATQVGRLAQPGDCVLVSPWTFGISFSYFYRGALPWATLPALADTSIHRYDLVKDAISTPDTLAPVLARLGETLRAGHRVWIVGWVAAPPQGQEPLILQPAPHDPRAGWSEAAYMLSYRMQVGAFLQAHAPLAVDVPSPLEQKISVLENMKLSCYQGWRP